MNDLAQHVARISNGWDDNPARQNRFKRSLYQPLWFDIDQRSIFRKSWQYLCREEQLAKPGDYMAASVGGQSIIACRQKDGSLKAFYNVCKHRGHELLSGHR